MSRPKWLNPLNSPYGDELVLQNRLSDVFGTFLLGEPRFDSADDGMEVFIIRETKKRSDRYYKIECDLARVLNYRETEHILEVERKFIQEVEALEHIRRSDIQNF
jgi:hypothetical protein